MMVMPRLALLISLSSVSTVASVMAQTPPDVPLPQWGTAAVSVKTIPNTSFVPLNLFTVQNMLRNTTGTGTFCTSDPCQFTSGIDLPTGAKIIGIDIEACDFAVGQATVELRSTDVGQSGTNSLLIAAVTAADSSCGVTSSGPLNVTVQNGASYYTLMVSINDNSLNVLFRAVRIRYQLQVSPSPTTATFTDVPTTHVFFQYIQALSAAGITSGCGGGNFCPDTFLTRGQMAVFLAKALGLHWAP